MKNKIIYFSSFKGGVGKSTLSISIASYLSQSHPVLFLDCDPQQSINKFFNNKPRKNITIKAVSVSHAYDTIYIARETQSIIIVDYPASTEIAKKMLKLVDIVAVPTLIQPFDVVCTRSYINFLNQSMSENQKAKVIFNQYTACPATKKIEEQNLFDPKNVCPEKVSKRSIYTRLASERSLLWDEDFAYRTDLKNFSKNEIKKITKNIME